jgi:hypothetical protein
MSTQAIADPIYDAIQAHKTAAANLDNSLERYYALEREIPREKRQSSVKFFEEKIVETDDPRWIAIEREVRQSHDACEARAIEILNVEPTTTAGLIALLNYTIEVDADGEGLPYEVKDEDTGKANSWHFFLIKSVADALPKLTVRS